MINLNECRITDEGYQLIIEASVDNMSYCKNVYIDSVIIDNEKTYVPSGPSKNPVFIKSYSSDYMKVDTRDDCNSLKVNKDCDCGDVYTSEKAGVKRIKLYLDHKDINIGNFNDNIFFIYVIATGIPCSTTPCGMDNTYVMGVAVNRRPLYNTMMSYINEMDKDCTIPRGFIDSFIKLKGFELSLKTGNILKAIDLWKKVFKNTRPVTYNKGCGCYGTYK